MTADDPAGDECIIITASRSHFTRDPSEYFENVMMENHPYGYHPRGRTRHFNKPPRPGEKKWTLEDVIYMGQHNVTALIEDFRAQHDIVLSFYRRWFSQVFKNATGLDILSQPFDRKKKFSWIHGAQCSALVLRSHGHMGCETSSRYLRTVFVYPHNIQHHS